MTLPVKSNTKTLPFADLNLRFNPFGELTRSERAVVAVVSLGDLPHQFKQPHRAIQFTGDHGRGKSTHLIKLHTHFNNIPYLKIYPNDTLNVNNKSYYFIDSFDCLSVDNRKAVYASSISLACTSHHDLTKEMKRHGFHVTTVRAGNSSLQQLHEIFTRRIKYARRSPGIIPCITNTTITFLINKFGDDIRSMEHYLYDRFQTMKGIENV